MQAWAQVFGFSSAAILAGLVSISVLGQGMFIADPSPAIAAHTFVVPFLTGHRNDSPEGAVVGALLGSALIPALSLFADTAEGKLFGVVYAVVAIVAAIAGAALGRRLHRRRALPSPAVEAPPDSGP